MKIGIASDHRGYELKQKIIKDMKGIEFVDFGTNSDKSVDYPDYAFKLCTGIINKKFRNCNMWIRYRNKYCM